MIIEYIVNHQSEFWLALGFVFLTFEAVTGFSSGIFLFAGLGAIFSGILMSAGVLPETWVAGLSSTGISSGIITVLLWKPLKNLQNHKPIAKDNSSDLIGHEFNLESDVSLSTPGSTSYSGINWKIEIDPDVNLESIKSGLRVIVTSVEVGLFRVKPLT